MRKSRSNCGRAPAFFTEGRPVHPSTKREYARIGSLEGQGNSRIGVRVNHVVRRCGQTIV